MSKSQADRLAEIHAFLLGEGPLDGVYFGDLAADGRGKFWWRVNLRAAIAKQQASPEALEHRPGCDALGGYGHGVGPCDCGATPPSAPQVPAVAQAVPLTPELVEERLHSWRQRLMNRSGDRLALDDFMGQESIDDLIDFVCAPATLSQGTSQAAANACKLTECQGQPRCRYCVAKDTRDAATGGVQISDVGSALADLVAVIDAAGLMNLSNGVQLGPTAWYVKATEAMEAARAILAEAGK